MDTTDPKQRTDEEWQRELTPDQFCILRLQGTERPFTGEYYNEKRPGVYHCVGCGRPLFSSGTKFDSGTGWPSYFQPIEEGAVELRPDPSLPERPRTEVVCAGCGGHLGHVFDDGPPPTGKRYCINSLALRLEPAPETP